MTKTGWAAASIQNGYWKARSKIDFLRVFWVFLRVPIF